MTAHELETRHFSYLHTQSPDLQNRFNPVCPPPNIFFLDLDLSYLGSLAVVGMHVTVIIMLS